MFALAQTPDLFFPRTARGHGSKRNLAKSYARTEGIPLKDAQTKIRAATFALDCSHEECRPSFDRLGPLGGVQSRTHEAGSSTNHRRFLAEREFGNDPKKERHEAHLEQCPACHGEGRMFDWGHMTNMKCVLGCPASKDFRGFTIA